MLIFLPGLDPSTFNGTCPPPSRLPLSARLHLLAGRQACGCAPSAADRPDLFPNLRSHFGPPVRVYGLGPTATPSQTAAALLYSSAAAAGGRGRGGRGGEDHTKRRRTNATGGLAAPGGPRPAWPAQLAAMPFPPQHYCLSAQEMADNNYPLPSCDGGGALAPPPGFVATQPAAVLGLPLGEAPPPLLAIDCEMCYTSRGLEARPGPAARCQSPRRQASQALR